MDGLVGIKEAPPRALGFRGNGILTRSVHGERIVNTRILQCERKRRNYIVEIEKVDDSENPHDRGKNEPPTFSEGFACGEIEDKKEYANDHKTHNAAQKKYRRTDGMEYHRNDEYRERKNGEKEKADLENESGIMAFKALICDECDREDEHEWPTHRKCPRTEIIDEECAEEAAEKELEDVNEPKMEPRRVLAAAHVTVLGKIDKEDASRHHKEVDAYPCVFPKKIHAPQGKGVENETADEGNRGDRPFESFIPPS